ncbi:MAG: PepSY-associated TM helix domain-containing protein [Maribacter stanieri]
MNRKIIWKAHSIIGLLVGIPLLIISLTGSILVFRYDIEAAYHPEIKNLTVPANGRLAYDTLIQQTIPNHPDYLITGWATFKESDVADIVFLMNREDPDKTACIYVNPYTGKTLTDIEDPEGNLTGTLLELHTSLLTGDIGFIVVAIIGILMILLGVTGMIIYQKFWRRLFKINWKSPIRSLTGNLHKRIGLLSSPFFIILGLTGTIWNIQLSLAEHRHHNAIPVEASFWQCSIDKAVAATQKKMPTFKPTYISLPHAPERQVGVYGHHTDRPFFRSDFCCNAKFHAKTGAYEKHYDINDAPWYFQLYDSFRPIHFGDFGGIPIKILWCILGLSPAILAISGSTVAILRMKRKKKL